MSKPLAPRNYELNRRGKGIGLMINFRSMSPDPVRQKVRGDRANRKPAKITLATIKF